MEEGEEAMEIAGKIKYPSVQEQRATLILINDPQDEIALMPGAHENVPRGGSFNICRVCIQE